MPPNPDRKSPTTPIPDPAPTQRDAVFALLDAHRQGYDVAEWIADVCAYAAAQLGSTAELLSNRPHSWEAGDLRHLIAGTVGDSDEQLVEDYGRLPGEAPPGT